MNARHAFRTRKCAAARTGGNQQTIDRLTVFAGRAGRRQNARCEIKPRGPSRKPEVEIQFRELFRLRQPNSVWLPGARQKLLGKWRTIVGPVCLIADERDRTAEAFTTKRFRGSDAGERSANNMDRSSGQDQPSMEMACFGQRWTHSSTRARESSPGSSLRT